MSAGENTPKEVYKLYKKKVRVLRVNGRIDEAVDLVLLLRDRWVETNDYLDKKAYDGAKKALGESTLNAALREEVRVSRLKRRTRKDSPGRAAKRAIKKDRECIGPISIIKNKREVLVHEDNIWNAYSITKNQLRIIRDRDLRTAGSGWSGIMSINHKKRGYGYIESANGKLWDKRIYATGSNIRISNDYREYKITSVKNKFLEIKAKEAVVKDPNFKIVVPIPAYGRAPLLRHTIRRLSRQALPIHKIIVMGCEDEIREVAESEGALYVEHKNRPLGLKWQYGMDVSREFDPDAVLMLGSSDWISDDWCLEMSKYIIDGYDLIGKRKMMFLDVAGHKERRLIAWNGYTLGSGRACEPIGAGRLFSRRVLDKIDWKLYNTTKNNNMDHTSMNRILAAGGKVGYATDLSDSIMALSLSFPSLWGNLHGFDSLCGPQWNSVKIRNCDEIINDYFPDAIKSFSEILGKGR